MAYTAIFQISIAGAGNNGLSLSAQLRALSAGVWSNSGPPVTTGWDDLSDAGNGFYLFPLSIPSGFVGGVQFTRTDNSAVVGVASITPQELEGADGILDRTDGVEPGWTLRQALRIMLAALAGLSSGLGSVGVSTPRYRDRANSKDRIVATTDAAGNRSAVTLDPS